MKLASGTMVVVSALCLLAGTAGAQVGSSSGGGGGGSSLGSGGGSSVGGGSGGSSLGGGSNLGDPGPVLGRPGGAVGSQPRLGNRGVDGLGGVDRPTARPAPGTIQPRGTDLPSSSQLSGRGSNDGTRRPLDGTSTETLGTTGRGEDNVLGLDRGLGTTDPTVPGSRPAGTGTATTTAAPSTVTDPSLRSTTGPGTTGVVGRSLETVDPSAATLPSLQDRGSAPGSFGGGTAPGTTGNGGEGQASASAGGATIGTDPSGSDRPSGGTIGKTDGEGIPTRRSQPRTCVAGNTVVGC